jgi:glycosyltransferase involved in cell wall biosynthesis
MPVIARQAPAHPQVTTMKALLLLTSTRDLSTYPAVYQCAAELKCRGVYTQILTGAPCADESVANAYNKHDVLFPAAGRRMLLSLYLLRYVVTEKPDIVICFNPRDAWHLALAALCLYRINFVYYNLEIFDYPNALRWRDVPLTQLKFHAQKILESIYCCKSKCLVIQDPIRYACSAAWGVSHHTAFYIPNSYTLTEGIGAFDSRPGRRMLYMGSLESWSIGSLLKRLRGTEAFQLTLSGWSNDEYLAEIRTTVGKMPNLTILERTLDTADLEWLVKQHDIGLVWYAAAERRANVRHIGRSSGKFFAYLKFGKPVIVQNLPGLADDVREYGLGRVIERADEIEQAVNEIVEHYDLFVERIERAYREVFDYRLCAEPFVNYIMRRCHGPR